MVDLGSFMLGWVIGMAAMIAILVLKKDLLTSLVFSQIRKESAEQAKKEALESAEQKQE